MDGSWVRHVRRGVGGRLLGGQASPQLGAARHVLGVDLHRHGGGPLLLGLGRVGGRRDLLDPSRGRGRAATRLPLGRRVRAIRPLFLRLHSEIQRLIRRLLDVRGRRGGRGRGMLGIRFLLAARSSDLPFLGRVLVVALGGRLDRRPGRRRSERGGRLLGGGRRHFAVLRQNPWRGETFLLRALAPLLGFLDLGREQEGGVQEIGSVGEDSRVGAHQAGRVEGQTSGEADRGSGVNEERAGGRGGQLRHGAWRAGRWRRVAESLMLGQRGDRAERLAAFHALDLHTAIGVHALVPAQIGELGVRLEADLALERLHAAVDVGVLLQPGAGRERLAAFGARVAPRAHVMGPDVALKIGRVREDLRFVRLLAKL